jgi:hypothetical protein
MKLHIYYETLVAVLSLTKWKGTENESDVTRP